MAKAYKDMTPAERKAYNEQKRRFVENQIRAPLPKPRGLIENLPTVVRSAGLQPIVDAGVRAREWARAPIDNPQVEQVQSQPGDPFYPEPAPVSPPPAPVGVTVSGRIYDPVAEYRRGDYGIKGVSPTPANALAATVAANPPLPMGPQVGYPDKRSLAEIAKAERANTQAAQAPAGVGKQPPPAAAPAGVPPSAPQTPAEQAETTRLIEERYKQKLMNRAIQAGLQPASNRRYNKGIGSNFSEDSDARWKAAADRARAGMNAPPRAAPIIPFQQPAPVAPVTNPLYKPHGIVNNVAASNATGRILNTTLNWEEDQRNKGVRIVNPMSGNNSGIPWAAWGTTARKV